ncbi:hypothetical protein CTT39_17465 [Agrobacterium rosae]|nr:hypothetical protein CTT39_17465 [Agrobacterium rosae]
MIGAGASAEFDLPVGAGLREMIINCATFDTRFLEGRGKGDMDLYYAIRSRKDFSVEAQSALKLIERKLYLKTSIDVFLDHNRHTPWLVEVGKLLIALCIGRAEAGSKIFRALDRERELLDLRALKDTWIEYFARILLDVESPDDIGKQVTIICFNYDRCIEMYLMMAIAQTFPDVDLQRAHTIVSEMDIIHPYGTLGLLPSRFRGGADEKHVPFAPEMDRNAWQMIKDLKIFTEREHDAEVLQRIRHSVAYSDNLIFMGFGFASQNMELLDTRTITDQAPRKRVYVSGRGISPEDEAEVQSRIKGIFARPKMQIGEREPALILRSATCLDLFQRNFLNFSS